MLDIRDGVLIGIGFVGGLIIALLVWRDARALRKLEDAHYGHVRRMEEVIRDAECGVCGARGAIRPRGAAPLRERPK